MTTEISHYGVAWTPDKIAYLQQERGGTNAIGLKESSPFTVRTRKRWTCNHLIGLAVPNPARTHLDRFRDIVSRNSLVRFLLPIPGGGVSVYHSAELNHVVQLLKMSAPTRLPILHAPLTKANAVLDELEVTNVQPFILAGVEAKHTAWVSNLIAAAQHMPRRLLIMSASDVPLRAPVVEAEHLRRQDDLDLVAVPWEAMGAIVLRAVMRSEWTGSWFTREPIPANEPKLDRQLQ